MANSEEGGIDRLMGRKSSRRNLGSGKKEAEMLGRFQGLAMEETRNKKVGHKEFKKKIKTLRQTINEQKQAKLS